MTGWRSALPRRIARRRMWSGAPPAPPNSLADHQKLLARLAADPARYGKVAVVPFNADRHEIAPAGSADFVLTFRNLHNSIERGEVDGALRASPRALKP